MKIPTCHLIFYSPAGKVKFQVNNNGGNIIGRKSEVNPPDVDLLVNTDDALMSRRHARIRASFGQIPNYLLSDMDSQNGTTLINKQREEMEILPGDEVFIEDGYTIRMGATEMVFEMTYEGNKTNLKI